MSSRAPKTLEEFIIGYLELKEGCSTEAVIPPPSACSDYIHAFQALADTQLISIGLIVAFGLILFSIILQSWNKF